MYLLSPVMYRDELWSSLKLRYITILKINEVRYYSIFNAVVKYLDNI